jgi:flagellar biosynthesis protein FlhF
MDEQRMNLQTFQAATMAQALTQVKAIMGTEAVILHTRTFQKNRWLGLRRQEMVEITAGRGMRFPERPARRPQPPAPLAYNRDINGGSAYSTSKPQAKLLEMPVAQAAAMAAVAQEMGDLKAMVKDLVQRAKCTPAAPDLPEDLVNSYLQLIESQVADDLARDIIKSLQTQLRPEHRIHKEFVRQKLAEQLEKMIPESSPIRRTKTVGPHIVALIGPTGVGKTTTIAKLAAHLKLREKRKIGLITIDTYRIAAVDQLRKYAEILGAPLKAVATSGDLREAIASMHDCEFVLIDTAGRSPNDAMKLSELKSFLAAASPDEVHLVLSTTASQACVELAINRFADVRVDRIIFTKLDEAAHLGVVLNVAKKLNKSLSYITTGQDVPDDIEVGERSRLAKLILGGAL